MFLFFSLFQIQVDELYLKKLFGCFGLCIFVFCLEELQFVCLLVGCSTSQQQASVSQGQICSDNFTCCHTEIQVADPTFYLTQSQYANTGPTSPSTDPITPGAWQGSHWSANVQVTCMTRPRKNPAASGIRTQDLPLSRWTPYHKANEAVKSCRPTIPSKG